MDGVVMYFCPVCETTQGLFYRWDEVEDDTEITNCGVCGSKEIEHVRDKDCEW